MIILTEQQANTVRGMTVEGSALAPFPLTDGTFALAEKNAENPHHAAHRDFLLSLPTREVSEAEIVHLIPEEERTEAQSELLAACFASHAWPVGEPISVAAPET